MTPEPPTLPAPATPHDLPPDTAQPDVSQPEAARPDMPQPDVSQPDVARPEVARPEVAHALVRALGPLVLGPDGPAPPGMVRLAHEGGGGLALPVWPDGATPSLLEEYQVNPVSAERPGEARRVLAACLKCCWRDLAADPWPGEPAPLDQVLAAYRALIGRNDDLMRNWAIGALRRLHDSAWVTLSPGSVRLGPRCAVWPAESHAHLRELVHRLPDPDEPAALSLLPVTPHAPPRDGHTGSDTPATQLDDGDHHSAPILPGDGKPPIPPAPAVFSHHAPTVSPTVAGHPQDTASPGGDRELGRGTGTVVGAEPWDEESLAAYDERRRAELVAAFMAVEHAAEPVQEARFAALRDPALRRTLAEMLARRGRSLIQHRERWISGYDEGAAAEVGTTLGETERAVLVLVLVHSVAIPRAEGLLGEDTWLSPHPTPVEELRRHTQLAIGELETALRVLRHAGLLAQVKAGEEAGGYVPGAQFHRLTPQARRRLQEELILAAGPHTPLAEAVRARRKPARQHHEGQV